MIELINTDAQPSVVHIRNVGEKGEQTNRGGNNESMGSGFYAFVGVSSVNNFQ